jgi:hypothetical protein
MKDADQDFFPCKQGCQMAYLHIKNPSGGVANWNILVYFMKFLVYFVVIWYILW